MIGIMMGLVGGGGVCITYYNNMQYLKHFILIINF